VVGAASARMVLTLDVRDEHAMHNAAKLIPSTARRI
jgi:hypothetical protein